MESAHGERKWWTTECTELSSTDFRTYMPDICGPYTYNFLLANERHADHYQIANYPPYNKRIQHNLRPNLVHPSDSEEHRRRNLDISLISLSLSHDLLCGCVQ